MLATSAGLPVLGVPGTSLCSNRVFLGEQKSIESNPSCFLEVTEDRSGWVRKIGCIKQVQIN